MRDLTSTGDDNDEDLEPQPQLHSRIVRGLWLPVALFLGISSCAVATSPLLRQPWSTGASMTGTTDLPPGSTLQAHPTPARVGQWEGDPRCVDDAAGDVTVIHSGDPVAEPVSSGGPGDITAVCTSYGDVLAVEVRMDEAVRQEEEDADEARLDVSIETEDERTADYRVSVETPDDDVIGIVEDNFAISLEPACTAATAWRGRTVRVEVDPACIGEPSQVGLSFALSWYDTDDFDSHADSLPQRGDLEDRPEGLGLNFTDYVRVPRFGGPDRGFPTPAAALASISGPEYVGACTGREQLLGLLEVCSYRFATTADGAVEVLTKKRAGDVMSYVLLTHDPSGGGWLIQDPSLDPQQLPPQTGCPPTDPACLE